MRIARCARSDDSLSVGSIGTSSSSASSEFRQLGRCLLASNHPNALVDALVVGCTLRRPVTLTAKATSTRESDYAVAAAVRRRIPLRRASDDAKRTPGAVLDPSRNATSFEAVLDVLADGGVVLLFPEGKSHSDPALAPLKTGLARMALLARDTRRLISLPIVPIGLTFERKWEPRSRVVMHIGPPIAVDGPPNAEEGAGD